MPSTYSSSLRLELQATGENANTWGTKTNNNLELIEQAIAGYVKITLTSASATYPLVIADASASDGRNAYIEFVGTVASAISITVPDVEKGYWVKNSATGSPLTFRTSSGTGVVLPTNQWVNLVSDGASITSTFPTSITGYALLSATQTFTGANTFTSLVNIQSNLSVTGNAFVSGVTTLASAVDIKGATSLASTLVVGGAATFNSNVSVSGVMVVGAGAVGAPSYSTTGDTNTGIYFPAADTIAVATSGTERMRIDNAGNVGIATTSPSSFGKFAVQGASNTRAFYADALAQPVARYDDNSYVSNGLTIRNTGISGSNQGIGLLFQLGAGGTAVDSGAIQMRSEADYSTAANQDARMMFFTAANGTNSERMRIDSSGNVGIGTSSPGQKLDVAGNLLMSGQSTADQFIRIGSGRSGNGFSFIDLVGDTTYSDGLRLIRYNTGANAQSSIEHRGTGNLQLITQEAAPIAFYTNSGLNLRMLITATGDVGIGTASPGAKLEVAGTLTATGNTINFGGNDATNTIMNVGGVPTGNKYAITDYIGDSTYTDFGLRVGRVNDGANGTSLLQHRGTGPMILDVFDAGYLVAKTNSTERMRITSTGLVGIGTSAPNSNALLTTNGNIAIAAPTRNQATSNQVGVWTSDDPADNGRAAITIATVAGGSSSSSYISFTTNNYGVDRAERMRIASTGDVGIGTSSPTASVPLTILANSGNAIAQNIRGQAAGIGVLLFTDNSDVENGRLDFRTNYAEIKQARNAPLVFSTNATERMRIDSSGNVGIGTSAPVDLLQVNRGSGSGITSGISLSTAAGGVGDGSYLKWTGAGTNEKIARIDGVLEGTDVGSIRFNTGNGADGFAERMRIDASGNVRIGTAALATTATDGFLYVPTCAGTPTGTPTAITGLAPIVINTTNNKLYFYSGGAWRDAGP